MAYCITNSYNNTLDKQNNQRFTHQQPNKGDNQRNKYSTKYETTLYTACQRNFKTVRGLTQHKIKMQTKQGFP